MINLIIRFVKKSPFLYNLAKKANNRLKRSDDDAFDGNADMIYYGYILKNLEDLAVIRQKYENLQKYNTKLFVLVDNSSYNIVMHRLIRENPDISFASLDYFKSYQAKLSNYKIMWLNYTDADSELLDYIR